MRFTKGDLIGFGVNIQSQEPVYLVRYCSKDEVSVVDLSTGDKDYFDLHDQATNAGCLYNFGSFEKLKERIDA